MTISLPEPHNQGLCVIWNPGCAQAALLSRKMVKGIQARPAGADGPAVRGMSVAKESRVSMVRGNANPARICYGFRKSMMKFCTVAHPALIFRCARLKLMATDALNDKSTRNAYIRG